MKEDAKKTRLDTSRNEPTATTTAERAISPLFFLSRLPSPVPLESPSGSHRPTARAPSLSAPRSAPSSSASPPTLVREIDQEEFSGKGEPPTTKRWLSSFSPFISLFRSPFSFHLPYESHLRLRQVYLHAPHDRRLRRRPLPPAGELKFAFFRPRDRPKNGKTQARRKTLTSPLDLFSLFFLSLSSSHLHTNFQAATPTPTRSSPT